MSLGNQASVVVELTTNIYRSFVFKLPFIFIIKELAINFFSSNKLNDIRSKTLTIYQILVYTNFNKIVITTA